MKIRPFTHRDAETFKALNVAWLHKYFYVEPYDNEVLSNPFQYILEKGGYIFMVDYEGKTVGTMSLIFIENGVYEFTKMAVDPSVQGKGLGKKMMESVIAFAKAEKMNTLILYSNRILENAIHIYKKYGFVEIPLETENQYERANIKMKLKLI
ncbi:N-acetyltransferase [Dokdonia sinensis]|uniref:N-acetyltransferase n=1 Tax=Dokdonia sinensis TaxID=2479847 RepID=A0A3M0G3E9_9FLAO|nr:GNAT family N-acetyltransferase [Dokdonia sinensis]RMB59510.1 N-acetyltransferase [Dokdonia sinensis]